ncbi:hypothetical protein [Sphingosinicella microcystinivorans]|uniref:Uncharacterized protein n=1 Tax=Sphingosinicella microcystinivorans TaxID=335406 RepID=A0AAD1D3C4_SPHMI|nr:hypothetical protein [Sphingosinicella microcystinivorans]RKS89069.1 hypothetical protein DFR51_2282 [Sphingosinicella microcystinivorans]BBE32825.1 hypothetical protein SmB9_04830 [Sphingosinicella microcystinivorans]
MSTAALVAIALMLAPTVATGEPPVVPEAVLDGDPETLEPPVQSAGPAAENAPDPSLLALQPATTRLFHALKSGGGDEELEKLVSAAVIELDVNCPRVREYQVFRSSARARTLKVKCTERPLYAITVGASGEGFVSGGDGTIDQMRLADGPIKAVMGLRVEEYLAHEQAEAREGQSAEGEALSDNTVVTPREVETHVGRRWLAGLALAVGLAAAGAVFWLMLRERRRQRRVYSRWRGLDTAAKDQLVEEAEEVYPNLYRHPEGVFIARGRRGKRRLFSSLVLAYLYASRGIKLFEIR